MSGRPLSVLMLAYYFPPRGGSGVQRSLKFARYLPEHGVDPVVVTASLDEVTQTFDDSLLEEVPNLPILRAGSGERTIRKLSRLRLGPLISLTLRPDAHILWRKGVRTAARRAIEAHQCEAIYASVQPWSAAMIGLELKRRHGLPLVVDFRDPWSFSTSLHWISKWHHRADARLEEQVFREADAIVTVTPGLVSRYRELYPFAAERIHLIYNGYDPSDFPDPPERGHALACERLKIGFAGRLYSVNRTHRKTGLAGMVDRLRYRNCKTDFTTHSLAYLVKAMLAAFERDPGLRDLIEFNLAGDIPQDNRDLVVRSGLADCIHFHGMVPHEAAVRMISKSDVVFLPMMTEESGQRSFNASGKIFEYLYNRKPILAAVPEGDAADLIRRSRAGWVVDPRDVEGLANRISDLVRSKRDGSLSVEIDDGYIGRFERRSQAGQLAGVLQSVACRGVPSNRDVTGT